MFQDRREAAVKLAASLERYRGAPATVVAGIPEGGAAVAAMVAVALDLPYTCVGLFKLPTPAMPDMPMGVLDEDGVATYDPAQQLTRHAVRKIGHEMLDTMRHEMEQCRAGHAKPDLKDATVILVDEAVFSQWSTMAACDYLRRHGAARVVLATPVLATHAAGGSTACADEVVALERGDAQRLEHYYAEAAPLPREELKAAVSEAYEHAAA